jgi:hypothetical protein
LVIHDQPRTVPLQRTETPPRGTIIRSLSSHKSDPQECRSDIQIWPLVVNNTTMANQVSTTQHIVDGTSSKLVIGEDSLAVGAPIDTSRVFGFFGLPLELRDRIYDHSMLLEDEQLPERSARVFKTKIRKLRTSLLLVSRQFHDEYRKICASQQVLYMEDHPWMSGTLASLQWPYKAPL